MDTSILLSLIRFAFLTQVKRGDLVFDPFAGTGSILIAAAHLGAYTLGSDIDIRVLRDGKTDSNGQVCPPQLEFIIVAGPSVDPRHLARC